MRGCQVSCSVTFCLLTDPGDLLFLGWPPNPTDPSLSALNSDRVTNMWLCRHICSQTQFFCISSGGSRSSCLHSKHSCPLNLFSIQMQNSWIYTSLKTHTTLNQVQSYPLMAINMPTCFLQMFSDHVLPDSHFQELVIRSDQVHWCILVSEAVSKHVDGAAVVSLASSACQLFSKSYVTRSVLVPPSRGTSPSCKSSSGQWFVPFPFISDIIHQGADDLVESSEVPHAAYVILPVVDWTHSDTFSKHNISCA